MVRPRKGTTSAQNDSAATVGYEAQLWQMADALRERNLQVSPHLGVTAWT